MFPCEDSKTVSVCPYPEKRSHLSFVNISPTLVIDTSMERSSRVLHHGNPKNWFSFVKKCLPECFCCHVLKTILVNSIIQFLYVHNCWRNKTRCMNRGSLSLRNCRQCNKVITSERVLFLQKVKLNSVYLPVSELDRLLFVNRPALYFSNYIFIIAHKLYNFGFRIKDTV